MKCIWCGQDLKGQQKKFCSRNCNRRYYDKITGRVPKREKKDRYPYVCKYCGKWCYAYDKRYTSYCGRKCSDVAKYSTCNISYCLLCGKVVKGEKKYCSDDCRFGFRRICQICGVEFNGMEKAKFHSRECELEHGRRMSRQSKLSNYKPKKIICVECGKPFTPDYGNKRRYFCSDKCLRKKCSRVGKATRRARKRGNGHESIDPIDILKRDKWTCQICGIKTPESLRGTIKDNAPEVDHIMPLASGGKHIAHNLQCACRKCNHAKGDSVAGQLILFAGVDYNAESQKAYSTSRA